MDKHNLKVTIICVKNYKYFYMNLKEKNTAYKIFKMLDYHDTI